MLFSSTAAKLAMTAGLWGTWCAAHSLFTEDCIINRTGLRRSWVSRYYRLVYVCSAGTTLVVVCQLTPSHGEAPLWAWRGSLRLLQIGLWAVALTTGYLSFRFQDIWSFLGVRSLLSATRRNNKLITYGIYGVIRHPQSAAGLLFLWTRDITETGLVVNVVLSTYLIVGAGLEEKKLIATFGDQYREYRSMTPAFFPKRIPDVRTLFFPPDRWA